MKILFVTTGLFPDVVGGMERHSHFLVRGLAELGVTINLIHPINCRVYFQDMPNVRNHVIPWPSYRFPYHYLVESYVYSRRIARFIEEQNHDFDVVYGQGYTSWAYLRQRRIPCVFNPHGLEPFQAVGWRDLLGSFPLRSIARYHARFADAIISLGGDLTNILRERCGTPPERLFEIPNAVELEYVDAHLPIAADRIPGAMLFVGRLAANKGVDVLLQAMERVDDPEAQLFIIGDGPLRKSLEQKNNDSRVHFLGRVSDSELFRWYGRVECLVFSSLFEGMPTVILEAMAARLPVIATDIGAVRELVDSQNGVLVPPANPDALADAIMNTLRAPASKRRVMGENGRAKVESQFTWSQVASLTYDLLQRLTTDDRRVKSDDE